MTLKQLTKAIPTVNEEGKTQRWRLTVTYSCDFLTRDFEWEADVVSLNKEPEDFTKAELLNLCNTQRFDKVFDALCEALLNPISENRIEDFNVDDLD
jgi:hypothetical protein